jgi:hypothetical protein
MNVIEESQWRLRSVPRREAMTNASQDVERTRQQMPAAECTVETSEGCPNGSAAGKAWAMLQLRSSMAAMAAFLLLSRPSRR